ncbi:hypothetical protein IRJ41_013133 [Triplophysa rosa]|uniref:Uncharacterized protein n=1 Tax=Triplophysa rosa TaxID=992332 RepID=A0A9W7TEF4_TRIRA|nr:hypothetical protein IRJ41_013133 [Triplophysa rosa]
MILSLTFHQDVFIKLSAPNMDPQIGGRVFSTSESSQAASDKLRPITPALANISNSIQLSCSRLGNTRRVVYSCSRASLDKAQRRKRFVRFAHRILEQGTCERGMGNWKLDYTLQKDAERELVRTLTRTLRNGSIE